MIFHDYIYFLFIFLFEIIIVLEAKIETNNSKREIPVDDGVIIEVVETHTKEAVPNGLLPPVPKAIIAPNPLHFNIEQWRACNMWCRLRIFFEERNIIKNEYFNRQREIKNIYGSRKIPGLFIYNGLLKRQKDIASRTNELQKATELTAHFYRPLFQLLQILLPAFGPNISPVLTGKWPPPQGPQPIPPPPRGNLIPLPQSIPSPIPQGPQPYLIPTGGSPKPVLIPKGHFAQHPFPREIVIEPKSVATPRPNLPPGSTPIPHYGQLIVENVVSQPQPYTETHFETLVTRSESPTPIPAPPLPTPQVTPLPIPPQPFSTIIPPPQLIVEEIHTEIVSPKPTGNSFHPTPIPSQVFRGESGIVINEVAATTVTPTTTTQPAIPTSTIKN